MTNVFLSGKKTILRPVSMSDIPLFTRWINDPETRVYLARTFPMTEMEEEDWVKKIGNLSKNPNDIVMMIETKRNRRTIGVMGLHGIDWVNRHTLTGTIIGEKNLRGKGYATDAKMVMLQYAFETLGMHKIISHVDVRNKASLAYSKRCGYVVEGILKEQLFREGGWVDVATLACFYDNWKKASKKQ